MHSPPSDLIFTPLTTHTAASSRVPAAKGYTQSSGEVAVSTPISRADSMAFT